MKKIFSVYVVKPNTLICNANFEGVEVSFRAFLSDFDCYQIVRLRKFDRVCNQVDEDLLCPHFINLNKRILNLTFQLQFNLLVLQVLLKELNHRLNNILLEHFGLKPCFKHVLIEHTMVQILHDLR